MKKITFRSYKISPNFYLKQLSQFFQINMTLKWKSFLLLQGQIVDSILKYHTQGKQVYIFQFGSITFVNFEEGEMSLFLDYIASLVGEVDYTNLLTYTESYSLYLDEEGCYELSERNKVNIPFQIHHSSLFASILAKSSALNKIEKEVSELIDYVEYFVNELENGRLVVKTTQFRSIIAKILRFEYDMIHSIRIFERAEQNHQYISSKEIYDQLAKDYELEDRVQGIQSKINDLRSIIKQYSSLSYRVVSNKNLLLESFLLALFPLIHILHGVFEPYGVFKWIPSFLPW